MLESIPTKYFEMLPLPTAVLKHSEDTLNHSIIYVNNSFETIIGWSLQDVPDKEHWWKKAYPDPQYQKVVESLWELSMESSESTDNSFVVVTVNIMTKHNGVKRFKVYTEVESTLLDGYYVVTFEETNESNN